MIDHVGISVKNLETSKAFFKAALEPLGYSLKYEWDGGAGLGTEKFTDFWLKSETPVSGPIHLAFSAKNRKTVDAFYKAAMQAGGRDNGGPGLRPDYHENYYGAFVFDPDGNNIEAVCHLPE